ncbi:MAG: alanine racemase [Actinobacteria bacterium]|nr:alanine racemase [Actinomycetota bacterium]
MFLNNIINKNPNLIKSALLLKKKKLIPSNCFILDLDAIFHNAKEIVQEAKKLNLRLYLMTKQINRNPFAAAIAINCGFSGAVAVDIQCARILNSYGIPVKHAGHLNQVPINDIKYILNIRPEVVTVFSYEEAENISRIAGQLNIIQDLLVRVVGEKDLFFSGQEGGFLENEFEETLNKLLKLKNVNIVGVTSFPCLTYNLNSQDNVIATNNMQTCLRVAEIISKKSQNKIKQINAPGNNYIEVFKILAQLGATHLEPGHALTATTPSHSFKPNNKGIPAALYVSEISHIYKDKAYAYGGGFWKGAPLQNNRQNALVGEDFDTAVDNMANINDLEQIIDYHIILNSKKTFKIGNTVICGFYTQMQMTRAYIAAVSGVSKHNPVLEGIFDNAGNLIDDNFLPHDREYAKNKIIKLRKYYFDE